jgi:hypothetical protein
MPYRDVRRKEAWEQEHHAERLARRRQLRQIEASRKDAEPEAGSALGSNAGILVPVIGAVALAAHSPKFAIGAGGVTLAAAAYWKRGWNWWIAGILVLILGFFFLWNDQSAKERIFGRQE